MANRLEEVLQEKEANYILPFVWQHGEDEAIIREEISRVYDAGIRAVCIEARPHPDFLGPKWWQDFDIIMEEARKRNMRVWVLDDDHFPTGHAAGKVKNAPSELQRLFLKEEHIDAVGPQKGASFLIKPWLSLEGRSYIEGKTLLKAVAARRDKSSNALTGEFIDLTSFVHNGRLYWDIPEGHWRIFLLITTPIGGSEEEKDYINPIVADSVRILLDTVYETFYERYPEDFGKTIAGFFSDEPGFYNDKQTFDYQSALGKKGVVLPWSPNLLELLEAEGGEDYYKYLPLLWHESGSKTAEVRYTYMNVVSRLYAENFTTQIGDWCRSHGVEYIGQILEDNGVHSRLGAGEGHFFRALWGQDMSGIDVVLWQIVPGFDEGPFNNAATDVNGEFFHYGLAKMGSSLGHIDPKKKGRTVCEIFGAYGWSEGLKLMKWLTDHMLIRGVNYFVPHAFSQAPFPDRDCPPHLYARGMNPQYRYYRELNNYTNRMSHLLSGGTHIASAAVLYHAEAEWSGKAMPFEKPVKVLAQNQIDCDVVPADSLLCEARVFRSKLVLESESYDCLIIPYSEALPYRLILKLVDFADKGLPVLFVEGLPVRASEGTKEVCEVLEQLSTHKKVQIITLADLACKLKESNFYEIETVNPQPYLRNFHISHSDLDVYMFFNEDPYQAITTKISLPGNGPLLRYDAFANTLSESSYREEKGGRVSLSLDLSPYESMIIVSGEATRNFTGRRTEKARLTREQTTASPISTQLAFKGPWVISTATAIQYPSFTRWGTTLELFDMSRPDRLPAFSGTFRYEAEFGLNSPAPSGQIILDLGEVYETAQIWVNEQSVGVRICPPYRFEITNLVRQGPNRLVVEVTNTLVKEQADIFSRFAQQEPSGLLGPLSLVYS